MTKIYEFATRAFALLTIGQKWPTMRSMNGNELIKKLKQAGYNPRLDLKRGKGSHATLYANNGQTILKDRKKEIGPGLLKRMLADLGLTPEDIK